MKAEKRICAAYIRVSTHDQEEYSPESQIKLIQDYAKKNDMLLPEEFIFRDDGISGRKAEKRPGFLRMIATAKEKPRPFDCILVWKFSRFARNQEESVVYKSLLKKENDIDVISISEPIMDGPFGGLIERIIEWFDAFYSANLGAEVRRGMTERASRGLPVSTAPLGYTYQNKELVIVPEEADTVQMIYRDFLAGAPMIAIAKKLNAMGIKTKRGGAWENRTVRYILTNPVYIGKIRWSKNGPNDYHNNALREGTMLVDGKHQPILSPDDFEAAQKRIGQYLQRYKGTAQKAQKEEAAHMLQGLVKCGSCGGTMTWTGAGVNCSRYVHGKCTVSHFISQEKLETLVLDAIQSQLGSLDFEVTRRQQPQLVLTQQHLRQRLKKEEDILRRHKEAYAAGIDTLDEYRANKIDSEARIQKLQAELAQSEAPAPIDKKKFAEDHQEALKALFNPSLSPQEKNIILRSFVDRITYHKNPNHLKIVFYL